MTTNKDITHAVEGVPIIKKPVNDDDAESSEDNLTVDMKASKQERFFVFYIFHTICHYWQLVFNKLTGGYIHFGGLFCGGGCNEMANCCCVGDKITN